MNFLVNLGSETVLVKANSDKEALKTAWLDIIKSNCEDGDRSVEKFREELSEQPSEEHESFLRSYTRSLRNFGYSWSSFALESIKCISEDTWTDLSGTYREACW